MSAAQYSLHAPDTNEFRHRLFVEWHTYLPETLLECSEKFATHHHSAALTQSRSLDKLHSICHNAGIRSRRSKYRIFINCALGSSRRISRKIGFATNHG
jgi:hypothetical protein